MSNAKVLFGSVALLALMGAGVLRAEEPVTNDDTVVAVADASTGSAADEGSAENGDGDTVAVGLAGPGGDSGSDGAQDAPGDDGVEFSLSSDQPEADGVFAEDPAAGDGVMDLSAMSGSGAIGVTADTQDVALGAAEDGDTAALCQLLALMKPAHLPAMCE